MPDSCYSIGLQACEKRQLATGSLLQAVRKLSMGVQTTWISNTEIMYGARYRFRVISTGTQSTKINAYAVFKK